MNTTFRLLINPYERIAGYTALALGLLVAIISAVLAFFFNTRFDGVLDIHFVNHISFYRALSDQLYNLLSLSIVFYLAGVLVKGNTFRWVDMTGTLFMARFPFMLAAFLNVGGNFLTLKHTHPGETNIVLKDNLLIVPLSVLLLVLLVWYITLLYKAYTISSNAKGWKAVLSFITALALAEVLSKVLIYKSF